MKTYTVYISLLFIYCRYNYPYHSMRSRPRGPPPTSDSDQMTADEIEIALSFLKKRFNDYSLDEILLSLSQHVQEKQGEIPQNHDLSAWQEEPLNMRAELRAEEDRGNVRRTRITHNNRDQRQLRENIFSISANNQEKLNKFEEIRLVAKFFCETGINFSLVRYFFPDITPQKYRAYLDTINNQTINQIQKFLRYECNIQIQHLSTDQKRSLKSQLIKVRDWLGQKNVSQLQTYYKFIQRHYEQKSVEVSYDEALKLYKTLLQIIKSPFIDIMEVIDNEDRDIEPRQTSNPIRGQSRTVQGETMTKEEENRVIEIYLRFKNVAKTSEFLSEKWGFSLKWSRQNINITLKRCLKKSLKKIVISKEKYLSRGTPFFFDDSDQEVSSLFESEEVGPIKEKIFKFYLANRVTATGLTNIIKELNSFFGRNDETRQIQLVESLDEVNVVPKVEQDINKRQTQYERVSPQPALETQEDPIVKAERSQSLLENEALLPNDDKLTEATEEQVKKEIPARQASKERFPEVIEID